MTPKRSADNGPDFANETIYAAAHVETWLEDYAKSHALPWHELTERVANFLLSQTGGTLLGVVDRMSTLRPSSTQGSTPLAKVAMDDGARSKVQGVKSKQACPYCRKRLKYLSDHIRNKHPKLKTPKTFSAETRARMAAAQQLRHKRRREALTA